VGQLGHINSSSGIGRWDFGRALLTAFTAGLMVPGRNRGGSPGTDQGFSSQAKVRLQMLVPHMGAR
jgi:hypothetical protein